MKKYRLAIVASHPIQYQSPLWREIAKHPDIDVVVCYCVDWGVSKPQFHKDFFGTPYKWDIPLLEGYKYKFLRNYSPKPGPYLGGFINPGIFWELWKNRYDAVLVMGWMDVTFWFAFLAAKLSGTPVFLRTVNSSYYDTHIKRPLLLLLFKKLCLKILFHFFVSGFLAIGMWNRNMYLEYGVPPERIFHFPYAVWNEFFFEESSKHKSNVKTIRESLGISPNDIVILFAARFIYRRHPEHAILAFEKLKDIPNATLLMVGDGEMMDELKKMSKEKNLKKVRFVGFKNQRALVEMYTISDIFVRADEPEEGDWGATVNEAMACGLPVVCTDTISSQADLVRRGENGFVYPLGDLDALAGFLRTMINDRKLLSSMKERSKEVIAKWGYREDVEGMLAVLEYCTRP